MILTANISKMNSSLKDFVNTRCQIYKSYIRHGNPRELRRRMSIENSENTPAEWWKICNIILKSHPELFIEE